MCNVEKGNPVARDAGGIVLLNADDYAMTDGVSRGILDLVANGRLSSTTALVTTSHWPLDARRLKPHRGRLAIGMHFNLTLGKPLGSMPRLASKGHLPRLESLVRLAVARRLERGEIEAEAERQLDRFQAELGFPPDLIDGHQHVHSLPVVRDALLAATTRRWPGLRPLIRHPGDRVAAIIARSTATAKALTVAVLAAGFARTVRRAGFPMNDSFAGISDFAPELARDELARAARARGRLHMIMCHPGYPDAELAAIDPVTERRRTELDALMREGDLVGRIWQPERAADGPPVDWAAVRSGSERR